MIFFAVVVVIGSLLVHRLVLGYPRPAVRFESIGRGDAAFVIAAADVFFPAGGPMPLSGRDADLPGRIDRYVTRLPARQRVLIRALFLLVEQSTLFFPAQGVGAFRRFSSMAPPQREAVIRGWAESGLYLRRMAFNALKAVFVLVYVGHPESLRGLGLSPFEVESPVCEADLLYPPIGASKASIRYGPEDITPPSDGTPLAETRGMGEPSAVGDASRGPA